MSQIPSESIKAPSGMDCTTDSVMLGSGRGQLLCNVLFDWSGILRSNVRLVSVLQTPPTKPITGQAYYYQATITNVATGALLPNTTDLLLVWVDSGFGSSNLFYAIPSANPFITRFSPLVSVPNAGTGNVYFPGAAFVARIRSAMLGGELIAVQDGGMAPQRFYANAAYPGPHYFQAGILAPPAPATSATGTGITGTYSYKQTYYDERGRESSPSPISTPLVVANKSIRVVIAWNADFSRNGFDKQIVGTYVYRNTSGGSVWYRVGNVAAARDPDKSTAYTLTTGDWILHAGDADDKATDAEIETQELAPNPGENDVPNPASVVAVHKNRLFLNDVTDNAALQISNLLSPTQFTSVPDSPVIATDGAVLQVGTDQGDPINALFSFGSVLGIYKRRGVYYLYGDDSTDWVIRPIHERGCIAPDSFARCDNVVCYLSDDGVYAGSYNGGEKVDKISKEIERSLLMYSSAVREKATATFCNNTYYLNVGATQYFYSFDANGWGTNVFGSGTYDLGIPGVPPLLVSAPGMGGGPSGVITNPDGGSPPDTSMGGGGPMGGGGGGGPLGGGDGNGGGSGGGFGPIVPDSSITNSGPPPITPP